MSQNNLTPPILYVGLDVAKASFVVHCQNRCHELPNDARGHTRLLRLLAKLSGQVHVVLEATGGYEQPIVRALHQAGLRVSVVLPRRVRAHAESRGLHAKTDALDAALLSDFGQATKPAPTPPRSPQEEALTEATRQRQQLVQSQTQHKNQAAHDCSPAAKKRRRHILAALAREIADCERELAQLQAEVPALGARAQRLQQAHGVGPIVAAVLLAELPELGEISGAQAAALAGLAPHPNDSGPHKGLRRIKGGRSAARRALYMAALTARRKDGILKRFYESLLARGKKPLVALTAVMRKLIVLLNRLLKDPNFQLQSA